MPEIKCFSSYKVVDVYTMHIKKLEPEKSGMYKH